MDLIVAGVGVPGHFAPKVNSTTQITLFEVFLGADVIVTPVSLRAGDLARVRFVQDGTGGHAATWASPPTYEGTTPAIATAPSSVTEVVLTVQSATVVEFGSFTGGGGSLNVGAERSLPDLALNVQSVSLGPNTLHAVALTQNNVVELNPGTTVGQLWAARRTDASPFRVIYQNRADQKTIGTLDRPNDGLFFVWTGTTWAPQSTWQVIPFLDFTLEQFDPNAGQGDQTGATDTRAFKAALLALASLSASPDGTAVPYLANRRLLLNAPVYYINDYLEFVTPSFYNSVTIEGRMGGSSAGHGTILEWVGGSGFVMTGSPALQFDAAARTITRLDAGSFIADGCKVGMTIWPQGTNNDWFHTVSAVSASVLTVNADYQIVNGTSSPGTTGLTDAMAMLKLLGARNTRVHRVEFEQRGKVEFGLHYSILPTGPAPTSGSEENIWSELSFYSPRNDINAAGMAIGIPPEAVDGPSDCALIRGAHLYVIGDVGTKACGWKALNANNVKDFVIDDATFVDCRKGIDWAAASGTLTGHRWVFSNTSEVDVDIGHGTCVAFDWETESSVQGARMFNVATNGQLLIHGIQWSGNSDDTWIVGAASGQVEIRAFQITNGRCCFRTITGVSTVDGTITYTGNVLPTPDNPGNGLPILMRASGHMPGGLYELGPLNGTTGATYWALNFGGGPGAYTCQLSATAGGPAIVPSTVGSGVQAFFSLPVFLTSGAAETGGMTLASGVLEGPVEGSAIFQCNGVYYPNPLSGELRGSGRIQNVAGTCSGIKTVQLTDFRASYEQNVLLMPGLYYYATQAVQAYGGIPNQGTTCYVFDATADGLNSFGGLVALGSLQPPPRCVLKAIRCYVAIPFAGPGLVSASFQVDDFNNGGPVLQAFLKAFDCKGPFAQVRDRRKGFQAADYGPNLLDVITVPANAFGVGVPAAPVQLTGGVRAEGWAPLYADPNGDAGWLTANQTIELVLTLVGIPFSSLTAGRLEVYLDFERIDAPANV